MDEELDFGGSGMKNSRISKTYSSQSPDGEQCHLDIREDLQGWYWDARKEGKKPSKSYLSVYWKCCHVFSRISINREGTGYKGNCPRCRASVSASIGDEGTNQRIFIAEVG